MAKNDNMNLWNSVEVTDPKYTKKVNQRGGFTAIGAQYQLMRATETFGSMGNGWGVEKERIDKWEDVGLAIYQANLWYLSYENFEVDGTVLRNVIPIHSSIKYHSNGRVDDDFFKKVATDALTKGLSKLGFNADVFMGKFDDNKYVNKLKEPDYKTIVTEASKGLNDEDKKSVLSNLDKVNALNLKAVLKRIDDMKSSYKDKS